MTDDRQTTASTFYSDREIRAPVPYKWLSAIVGLLDEFSVAPVNFCASGGVLDSDEFKPLGPRLGELVDEIKSGQIYAIFLQCPLPGAESMSEWRASASCACGEFFMGVNTGVLSDPRLLMRRVASIAVETLDAGYGFAFTAPGPDESERYACGVPDWTLPTIWASITGHGIQDPLEAWSRELTGPKRHLRGCFRGAYPSNLLSKAHVSAAGLEAEHPGMLWRLNGSHWIWELAADQISAAEDLLRARGVLLDG
jgi:hypothetical protein